MVPRRARRGGTTPMPERVRPGHVAINGAYGGAGPSPEFRAPPQVEEAVVTPLAVSFKKLEIPETCSCDYCGGKAHRVNRPYEQPYVDQGKRMVARCAKVPGYRCDPCDDEFEYLPATLLVLEAALSTIKLAGDIETATYVAASLAAGKRAAANDLKNAS